MPITTFDRRLRPLDPIFDERKRMGGIDVAGTPPTPVEDCLLSFQDTFNRANGLVGNGWVNDSGGLLTAPTIVSNQITEAGVTGRQLFRDLPMCYTTGGFWAEITVANNGSSFGNPEFWVMTNFGPGLSDMYNLGIGPNSNGGGNNDGWRIRRQNPGALLAFLAWGSPGGGGAIPTAPWRMRIEMEPGAQRLYGNPVTTLRLSTTDSTHVNARIVGMRCSSGIVMDDFTCGLL